jgi:type III secretion system YscI/HrpB-like protein
MTIELSKPIVSQTLGIQKIDSNLSSGVHPTTDRSGDANWFNQILATPANEPVKPLLPGVENTLQKISTDFSQIERKGLELAKKPDPVKLVAHTMEVSNAMFRVAMVTKLASQAGRSLDKLTSLN